MTIVAQLINSLLICTGNDSRTLIKLETYTLAYCPPLPFPQQTLPKTDFNAICWREGVLPSGSCCVHIVQYNQYKSTVS